MSARTESGGGRSASVWAGVADLTVVRAGALGDFVVTLPALRALASGGRRLRLVGNAAAAAALAPELLDEVASIDEARWAGLFDDRAPWPDSAGGAVVLLKGHAEVAARLSRAGWSPVLGASPYPPPESDDHVAEHLLRAVAPAVVAGAWLAAVDDGAGTAGGAAPGGRRSADGRTVGDAGTAAARIGGQVGDGTGELEDAVVAARREAAQPAGAGKGRPGGVGAGTGIGPEGVPRLDGGVGQSGGVGRPSVSAAGAGSPAVEALASGLEFAGVGGASGSALALGAAGSELVAVGAEARRAAAARLQRLGVGGPYAAIHPGSGSRRKNWPVGRFAELARRSERQGARPVVLAGPADPETAAALAAAGPWPLVSEPPLQELAALLAGAALYVGNDSGVSHLAGAVGAPTVAVFGPTRALRWRPLGRRVEVVEPPSRCQLCAAAEERPAVCGCIEKVEVEAVVAAFWRVLGAPVGSATASSSRERRRGGRTARPGTVAGPDRPAAGRT